LLDSCFRRNDNREKRGFAVNGKASLLIRPMKQDTKIIWSSVCSSYRCRLFPVWSRRASIRARPIVRWVLGIYRATHFLAFGGTAHAQHLGNGFADIFNGMPHIGGAIDEAVSADNPFFGADFGQNLPEMT